MSAITDLYENAINKLYWGETNFSNFSLLSYASDEAQSKLEELFQSGVSTFPSIEDGVNVLSINIQNSAPSVSVESILTDSTLGSLSYYLDKTDRALVDVFSPYSSQVRSGALTYGQATTKAMSGGQYFSTYGAEVGAAAKTLIAVSIAVEVAGSLMEVANSSAPLNEAGKQAWGIAGGLAGADFGAKILAGAFLAAGVTSAPVLLGVGAVGAVIGWASGEQYFEYMYEDLLPQILDGSVGTAAADITEYVFSEVNDFVDNLWESTGEIAGDFYDQVTDGVGDVGEDLMQLADDYGWAIGEGYDAAKEALSPITEGILGLWDAAKDLLPPPGYYDPLVLDLNGNGVDLAAFDGLGSIYWNADGDEFASRSGWVSGGDGLLALDLNGDGIINGQSELFGSQGQDGFSALAAYDTNTDGIIDVNDAQFGELIVWIDANNNGQSETGELNSLTDLNITSINLASTSVNYEIAGNLITHEGSFVINGQTQLAVNVGLATDHMDTAYVADYTLDIRTLFLPTLRGYGKLADLHIAMSADETLLNMVSDIATADTSTLFSSTFDVKGRVIDILYRWADVENAVADSRGVNIDARTIEFMEEYFGEEWVHTGSATNPNTAAAEGLEWVFSRLVQQISNDLLVQTEANSFYGEGAYYDLNEGQIIGSTFSSLLVVDGPSEATRPSGVNDVYVVSPDTGTANILEGGGTDTLWFAGVGANDLRFTRDGYDLLIHHPNGVITVINQYKQNITQDNNNYEGYKIETLKLADGTEINLFGDMHFEGTGIDERVDGRNADDTLSGYGGDDSLNGEGGDDLLVGGTGEDVIRGGLGQDIYEWTVGDGNDEIHETGAYIGGTHIGDTDTLKLHGVVSEDIRFEYRAETNGHHLYVHIGGESIKITDHFYFDNVNGVDGYLSFDKETYKVETVVFDDQSTIDLSHDFTFTGSELGDLVRGIDNSWRIDTLIGGGGDDNLYAYKGDDTLIGGAGDDTLSGGTGNDTYIWSIGDGNDFITESGASTGGYTVGGDDTLILHSVTQDQIRFEKSLSAYASNLLVHIGDETISINNHFNYYEYPSGANPFDSKTVAVELIELDDGTIINLNGNIMFSGSELGETIHGLNASYRQDVIYGHEGNDNIFAYKGDDTLIGGAGDDTLSGGTGNDTYIWSIGDGNDFITESGASTGGYTVGGDDTLILHSVTQDQIRFEKSLSAYASNLLVHIGDETISINNHFNYYEYPSGANPFDSKTVAVELIELDDGTIINLNGNIMFSGSELGETIHGLNASYRQDVIYGHEGNDNIFAYKGDDTLIGGAGADTLTGGTGEDLFVIGQDDLITDYSRSQRDVVDLSSALDGNFDAETDNIADYVKIHTSGVNKIIQIDPDGGADNFTNFATFSNSSGLTNINYLFDNGYIIISGANNTAPTAANDSFTNDEDIVLNGNVLSDNGAGIDSDADSDTIFVRAESKSTALGGNVSINNDGSFVYTPAANAFGQDSFTYILMDHYGGTTTGTVTITVNAVNDAPIGMNDLFAASNQQSLTGNLLNDNGGNGLDYDVEGDLLSVTAGTFTTTSGGTITIQANGDFTYTALSGFIGYDEYSYTLSDGNGGLATVLSSFYVENDAHTLFKGTTSTDTLNGSNQNDYIIGQTGNDLLYGDTGDDVYQWAVGDGNDTISEAGGQDTLRIIGALESEIFVERANNGQDVLVKIGAETITIINQQRSESNYDQYEVENIRLDDGTLININDALPYVDPLPTVTGQTLVGTDGNDDLVGTADQDILMGGLGNDIMRGAQGSDIFKWTIGDGNDWVYEWYGDNDVLLMHGVSATDIIFNTSADHEDLIIQVGSESVSVLDHTHGSWNQTNIDHRHLEKLRLDDGTEIDLLGQLTSYGTNGSDYIYGRRESDVFFGNDGNDTLLGYYGNDTLNGGAGDDTMNGGEDSDTYHWSVGDGHDEIIEWYGTDELYIHGADINDLRLGVSTDHLNLIINVGDNGRLTVIEHFRSDWENTIAHDRRQLETIKLDDGTVINLLSDQLTFTGTDGAETIYTTRGDDILVGDGGDDILNGYYGNDTLYGGTGNDELRGSAGDDTYHWSSGDGSDTIFEWLGADSLHLHGLTMNDIALQSNGSGYDLLIKIGGEVITVNDHYKADWSNNVSYEWSELETIVLDDNTVIDLLDNVTFTGSSSSETVHGINANDITYGLSGDDLLYGYNGNDGLYGGDGDDQLRGGNGNDILYGGDGYDELYGQGGADDFIFEAISAFNDIDSIKDFNTSQSDRLDLSDLIQGFDPLTDAIEDFVQITTNGANSTLSVDIDGGADNFVHIATIENVTGLTDEDLLYTNGNLVL